MTSAGGASSVASPLKSNVDWQRKLAFRYRRIREVYETYSENVEGFIGFLYCVFLNEISEQTM